MLFFGKDEASIYSSMQNKADGCFPISDEGVWHAGIHVYFNGKPNAVIQNPIGGKIVSCSFDKKKDWNYIILENDIIFPEKKGEGRVGYHCFNLISNIDSKMPYDELNKSFKLNSETLNKLEIIPFYIQLETTLPVTKIIKDNFKKVTVPINQERYIDAIKIGDTVVDECLELSNLKDYGVLRKESEIKIENKVIGKSNDDITVKVLKDDNSLSLFELEDFSTNIKGKYITLSDDIPKGFFVLNGRLPNKYGNIEISNKKNFNLWTEEKKSKNISSYPGFGLIVRKKSDAYYYILNLLDGNRKKKLQNLLNSINEKNGIVYVVRESQKDKLFPFIADDCKFDTAYKIVDRNGNDVVPFFITEDEYDKKFEIRETIYGINISNLLDKARNFWETEKLKYTIMKRNDISSLYRNLFNCVKLADDKGVFFDEKHLYNAKTSKFISDLYAIAKPHLFSLTQYNVKVSADNVYHEKMIVRDINEICLFNNTNTQNGYPCGNKIKNISGQITILNTADYLSSIKNQPDYIWIKTDGGYIYLSKNNYLKLEYRIKEKKLNKGDFVNTGEILGCPALSKENLEIKDKELNPYVDYALFFSEDITTSKTTLETVNIEEGTDCITENITYVESNDSIFLPPEVNLTTEPINDEYKKIKYATCTIYVYDSQVLNKKLKADAENFFIPSYKCKIMVKEGIFDAVSPTVTNEADISLLKDFTNKFLSEMKGKELTGPKPVTDGNCYIYNFKFDINAIVKKDITNNGQMQFIKTYNESKEYKKTKTPKSYNDRYVFTSEKEIKIDGQLYYPIIIDGKLYYILKKDMERSKENVIKEFREECETFNYGKNPLTTKQICPEDKLYIENISKKNINEFKKDLRTKLKEKAPDYIEYVNSNDIETGYNIYNNENNKNFYKLLSEYLKKTVSVHPLEWDFELLKDVCKTRGKAPVDQSKNSDIFAELKNSDKKNFSTNLFYFACPTYFYNRMEELGLLLSNPYQGVKDYSRLGGTSDPIYEFKINPGFAPFCENEKGLNGKFKYEYVLNNKKLYFAALNNPYGYSNGYFNNSSFHTGIDFPGTNDLNIENAPIMALVKGRIWACTTGNGSINVSDDYGSYGRCMIIKGDNDYLYILGHLHDFAGHKNGDYISQGEIVAHAGNTGHSDVQHLHLELIECKTGMDDDSRSQVLNMEYNKLHENDGGTKGEKKAFLRFATGKDTLWGLQYDWNWTDHRLNPLTGEKN